MCCLIALFSLAFPRITLVVVWLLDKPFIDQAYSNMAVPVLGLIFLPLTTLAYAWAFTFESGVGSGGGILVIVIAVFLDLGTYGGGATTRGNSSRA